MFSLEFSNRVGASRIARVTAFRMEGHIICHDNGSVVATHHHHFWQLHGERYSMFRVDCPVWLTFQTTGKPDSRRYGPILEFRCGDGFAYADGEICAFCDPAKNDWYSYHDHGYWLAMHVSRAERAQG